MNRRCPCICSFETGDPINSMCLDSLNLSLFKNITFHTLRLQNGNKQSRMTNVIFDNSYVRK